jgi:crotonobetainyl-CoA:carnitine CoA-transferase CaiB-like acyl-CoA transferase
VSRLPLEGVRILDLTQVAVGPYATFMLGFMGAQVIKVESTSRTDTSRGPAQPIPTATAYQYPGGVPGDQPGIALPCTFSAM